MVGSFANKHSRVTRSFGAVEVGRPRALLPLPYRFPIAPLNERLIVGHIARALRVRDSHLMVRDHVTVSTHQPEPFCEPNITSLSIVR